MFNLVPGGADSRSCDPILDGTVEHSYTSICHVLTPQWRGSAYCQPMSFSILPCIVQEVANATLCVESARPGARVTVFNATNDVLQPPAAPPAATTFASLAHGRWGLHRLDVPGP